MPRTVLGSRWREIPLVVRLLMLPSRPDPVEHCETCGATWERDEGPECRWCRQAEENQRRWQAELVLEPPNVDPDDITYDGVMTGWAERLAVAVEAGLIDRRKAEAAWKRATRT